MNIVHICSVTPKPEGIKTVLKKLSFKQREQGNNVRVFSLQLGEPEFQVVNTIKGFNAEIKSNRPDIVIFHSIYFLLYIPFVISLWLKKIPYAIQLHGALSAENYKVSHKKKLIANFLFYNRFIKQAKSIIYLNINEYKKSIVKEINPNYTIIPNGCDLISDNHIKQEPNDPIKIVYIGRIERVHKGLDILLDAIELISNSDSGKKVRFTFYGDGSDSEVIWFKEQIKQVDQIAEYKGPIYGKQKELAIRESDIFILTSRSEGMPMGVLEALSYGLPCILTPETNIGEEVKIANAGWLTDTNADQIASVINKSISEYLIEHDSLRHNAIRLSNKYNWEDIATFSVDEYQRIVNN